MVKSFIVKNIDGKLFYDSSITIKPEAASSLSHTIRFKILKLLSKAPMYPAEIAKKIGIHEQKIYYHMKQLMDAGILEIVEKKEIRGTTAKKFAPKSMNFVIDLEFRGKNLEGLKEEDTSTLQFLEPFIKNHKLNTKIVVGSPDPHGPFKARARDGHYAIDMALFLGGQCTLGKRFSTMLDVDVNLKKDDENLIIVGGPVTNMLMAKINDNLPAKFSEKRPWGIQGREEHTDDNIGLIAKIPHPNFNKSILVIAGIRYAGTKAAVIALTRHTKLLLSRYTDQKEFYSIVQGFDLDSDGKIDSVEILE